MAVLQETKSAKSAHEIYASEQLHRFSRHIFEAQGMRGDDADLLATHLIWAELHGIAWLGMRKVLQYSERMRRGGTRADAQAKTISDRASLVIVDGQDSWGQVVGHRLMKTLIAKARSSGICMGLVRNTTTAGALGYFASLAAQEQMIGMAINNSPPLQSSSDGKTKVIGNQAFAIASPAGRHRPIILDMATSAITLARIHDYDERGETIPEGVALNAAGEPTVDPAAALAGVLLPMAGHRGFGLALMWEVLTGILSGGEKFAEDVLMPDAFDRPQGVSLFMLAIDPEAVMPYAEFQARIDRVIDGIHGAPPAKGTERLSVPGERSQAIAERRRREGIPVPKHLAANLKRLADELRVAWPG